MKICIDPGHGGKDPGGGNCQYFKEKDWTLKSSLYMRDLLVKAGHTVIMTRIDDATLIPAFRARFVRESGADICISNHTNNVAHPGAHGLEIFHSIHAKPAFAQAVANVILATGLIRPRSGGAVVKSCESQKHPGQDYYYMIRDTGKTQTIIIEYGFASNPQDAMALHTCWRQLIEAAVKGVVFYCDTVKG